MGLWYPKDSGFELKAFADADYAGCHDTRRSTSGSAQFLGHRLVSWSSKKQKSTAISTTEAEYIGPSGTVVLKSSGCASQKLRTMDLSSTKFRCQRSNIANSIAERYDTTNAYTVQDRLPVQKVSFLFGYSKVILWNAAERDVVPPRVFVYEMLMPGPLRHANILTHMYLEEIKKAFIQKLPNISLKINVFSNAKRMEIRRRNISKLSRFKRYVHVETKISVWQSQSERRSQSNSEK
ncbi:hypothetical protein Tco_0620647 [Tanacetum coccineum]